MDRLRPAGLLPACLWLAALALPATAAAQTVSLNQGGRDVRIAIGDAAALPADFPADVPLPSPRTMLSVERSDGRTTLVIVAPGTVEEQAERLRSGMQAQGWRAAAFAAPPTGQGQAWEKDARAVLAWLQPADAGGTRIQLQLLARR